MRTGYIYKMLLLLLLLLAIIVAVLMPRVEHTKQIVELRILEEQKMLVNEPAQNQAKSD